jgi:hypothetical protein
LTNRLEPSHAPLGEQILNISVTEIEPVVEPNGVADDIGRKLVAFIGVHPEIIDQRQLTCQYPSWLSPLA